MPTVSRKELRKLQLAISAGALLFALAHLIWPALKIDAVTVALVTVAVIPWLAPLFKTLEFPGGMKIEFQELERAKEEVQEAGLIPSEREQPSPEVPPQRKYDFLAVQDSDPNLALAGLRIEIEKRLTTLAQASGVEPQRRGISGLLSALRQRDVLGRQEQQALGELSVLLDNAVHGAEVDKRATAWAADVGTSLIAELDRRIEQIGREPGT